jgi:protein phosphatase
VTVLRSGSATDVGRVRTINQDLALVRPNLFAVADGMGGHVGGEVAARVAVETLDHAFERAPTVSGFRQAFSEANAAVWSESQANTDLRGMGTTLTAMALVGDEDGHDLLALANVGDSRAYVFSEGDLVQITDDHSLAEERMRHGEMTEAEAAVHPQRHILTRALGVSSDVEADMWELHLRTGDRVLLCSDGLSNEVEVDEIADVLGGVPDPEEAARRLVDVANEHGGADNITVVIVDVQTGEEEPDAGSKVMAVGAATAAAAAFGVPGSATREANGTSGDVAPGGNNAGAAADTDLTQALPVTQGAQASLLSASDSDTLAPGARLDFGDETATLAEDGPRSDEFFLGAGAVVPVARATTRVPPERRADVQPEKESRGARRRRLGIPRRVTFRVIGFLLLVAGIAAAAYFVVRWYAYDNWIVTTEGDQIVVKQGQPGGVLWFHPRVVDRTGHTTSQIPPAAVGPVNEGVQESSLSAARNYVTNLVNEATTTTTTTSTTSTTAAPGNSANGTTTTSTTAPGGGR